MRIIIENYKNLGWVLCLERESGISEIITRLVNAMSKTKSSTKSLKYLNWK